MTEPWSEIALPLATAHFVTLDFETVNASFSSICQFGMVEFQAGVAGAHHASLIDPKDEFGGMNVSVRGITEKMVRGAATFPQKHEHLARVLTGNQVVTRSPFDQAALRDAEEKHWLPSI